MHREPEALQDLVKLRQTDGFLRENDRLHLGHGPVPLLTQRGGEQLKIVQALHAGLEQHVSEIRLKHALEQRRVGQRGIGVHEHVVVVPAALSDERRHQLRGGALGADWQAELVVPVFVRSDLAGKRKLTVQAGAAPVPLVQRGGFAFRRELKQQDLLPGDRMEGGGEAMSHSGSIEPRRQGKQRDDPADARLRSGGPLFGDTHPARDRVRKAAGEARVAGEEVFQFAGRQTQEHGVRGDDGGEAMRLIIEKGTLTEGVAGAADFLHHGGVRAVPGLEFAPAGDHHVNGGAPVTFMEKDGAFRILIDRGVGEELPGGAVGKQREERVRLKNGRVYLHRLKIHPDGPGRRPVLLGAPAKGKACWREVRGVSSCGGS